MKQICFVFAIVLYMAVPAFGAAPIVEEVQRAYGQMERFSADFTQELLHAESGGSEKRTGKLTFEKPLNIRWETFDPNPELLVVNKNEVWDYLPDEELAYRYSPEVVKDSRSILQVVTGQSRLDTDFDVKREADRDGLIVLRLFPKEPSTQMVETLLFVDPVTKLLRRAEILDFYGNTNNINFSNVMPNAKAAANAFSFTPPKGITVEDLQKEGAPERQLLQ